MKALSPNFYNFRKLSVPADFRSIKFSDRKKYEEARFSSYLYNFPSTSKGHFLGPDYMGELTRLQLGSGSALALQ